MGKGSSFLIKNADVIRGTKATREKLDVLVEGDRIVRVAPSISDGSVSLVNGAGLTLVPGFIDPASASDHFLSLFIDSHAKAFLASGVTTIVGGMDGSSLAPLFSGSLESIRKWANGDSINVDWDSFSGYLDRLEKLELGINFGSFVGHSTVRRGLFGSLDRDLTEEEIERMNAVFSDALSEGAFGVSMGLAFNHSNSVSSHELESVASLCAEQKRFISMSLRFDGAELKKGIDEAHSVAKASGARMFVNHFKAGNKCEAEFEEALKSVADEKDFYLCTNVSDWRLIPIYFLLPAIFRFGPLETMLSHISKADDLEEIRRGMSTISGDHLIIARCPNAEFLVGKTLKDFATSRELTVKDALFELMKLSSMRAVLLFKGFNGSHSAQALHFNNSLLSSSLPSVLNEKSTLEHSGVEPSFKHMLSHYRSFNIEFERLIQKLTFDSAEALGLSDRGRIERDAIADLVLLKDGVVEKVYVSGVKAFDGGRFVEGNGKILRA